MAVRNPFGKFGSQKCLSWYKTIIIPETAEDIGLYRVVYMSLRLPPKYMILNELYTTSKVIDKRHIEIGLYGIHVVGLITLTLTKMLTVRFGGGRKFNVLFVGMRAASY